MQRRNPFQPLDPRPLPSVGTAPLEVCLIRGNAIESRHRVHAVIADSSGRIQKSWGDPELTFFPRSSIKIIQSICWVAPGYADRFDLGDEEMAIACGSHEGEAFHERIVGRWLQKLKLRDTDLECGIQEPNLPSASRALARAGGYASQIHNNCSGKHCGFLTACFCEGLDPVGYTNYDHPIQAKIRELMTPFFGMSFVHTPWGIDGCGIPTYLTPLKSLARAMANVADPSLLDVDVQRAIAALNKAVRAHPEMIGGSESFSSRSVLHTQGRVLAKVGAEGVYGVWIPASGIGIALKCEDGNVRGAEAALAAILSELGHPLSFYSPLVHRWTGETVGQFIVGQQP
jgi:L-asparaginase II